MSDTVYPSDLMQSEWEIIENLFPASDIKVDLLIGIYGILLTLFFILFVAAMLANSLIG